MKHVPFPQNEIPLCGAYDAIVCGGGLSGIAAAWNGARRGLKILLLEHFSKLGGVPVSGMLGIVSGFRLEDEIAIDGAFWRELLRRGLERGICTSNLGWRFSFSPEGLSLLLSEMMEENGVTVLLQTTLVSAQVKSNTISYIVTASKAGLEAWEAPLFIDDTGDADLAALAGCPFEYGRPADGMVQSSSLTFKLAGIDMTRIPPNMVKATEIWRRCKHRTPTNHTVITYLPNTNGEAAVNMSHILKCNPLTHEGQCRIRLEGAQQAQEIAQFFRENLPGFEKCYVAETAMQPGVRETRRIIGDYTLTEEDVIEGHDFPDEIARGAWGIDIHVPDCVHGETPMPHFCLQRTFAIPYRCLLPQGIRNLYVAGRPISATHEAFSASRINGTCLAIGEAVGVAAPMALENGDTRAVNVPALQASLEAQGAIVHRRICK